MRRLDGFRFALGVSVLWVGACSSSSDTRAPGLRSPASGGESGDQSGAGGAGVAGGLEGGSGPSEAGAGAGSDAEAGGAAGVDASAGQAGAAASRVHGRVVDFESRRPLAKRRVQIGDEVAVTDARGAFALEVRDSPFDVAVVEPDHTVVSLFVDVSGTDLVLPHGVSAASFPSDNVVDLRGTLVDDDPYPLAEDELVTLRFLAERAEAALTLPPAFGPDFGPMRVAWDGDDSVSGTLVAIRSRLDENGNVGFTAVGTRELALRNGEDVDLEFRLESSEQGRLSGRVEVPAAQNLSFIQRHYRVPFSFGSIPISIDETQATTFDLVVPNLGALGGSYCVGAGSSDPFFLTETCGLELGATDIVLTLALPPEPLEPNASATVHPDDEFSWTAFDGGVHRLSLIARTPSEDSPSVFLFTAEARARFSELSRLAQPFLSRATYDYSVAGYGRFDDLDDALSEQGIVARFPREIRAGVSSARTIVMAP